MSLQGTLKTLGIAEVLEFLATREATGRLDVTTEMGSAVYVFADGEVAGAEYSFIRESGNDAAEATYYVVSELDGSFLFDEDQVPVEVNEAEDVASVLARTADIAERWHRVEAVIPTPGHLLSRNSELDGSVTIEPAWWKALEIIGAGTTPLQLASELDEGLLSASTLALAMANAGLIEVSEQDPLTMGLDASSLDAPTMTESLQESPDAVQAVAPADLSVAPLESPAPPSPEIDADPAAEMTQPVEVASTAVDDSFSTEAPAPPIMPVAVDPAPVAPAVEDPPVMPVAEAPAPPIMPVAEAPAPPVMPAPETPAPPVMPAPVAPVEEPTFTAPSPFDEGADAPQMPAPVAPEAPAAPLVEASAPAVLDDPFATTPVEPAPATAPAPEAIAPAPEPVASTPQPDVAASVAADEDDGWSSHEGAATTFSQMQGTAPAAQAAAAASAPPPDFYTAPPAPVASESIAEQTIQDLAAMEVGGPGLAPTPAPEASVAQPSAFDVAPADPVDVSGQNWQLDETFGAPAPAPEAPAPAAPAPDADSDPFGALSGLIEDAEEDRGSVMKFLRRE